MTQQGPYRAGDCLTLVVRALVVPGPGQLRLIVPGNPGMLPISIADRAVKRDWVTKINPLPSDPDTCYDHMGRDTGCPDCRGVE